MGGMGRALILIGAVLLALGLLLTLAGRFGWPTRLPGDIVYERGRFRFYFPVVTCLLLSLLLTFVMWLLKK